MTTLPQADEMRSIMIREFGIGGLPAEKQKEALAMIFEPIIQSVTLGILTKLPVETHEAFAKALENNDSTTIETLITTHIQNPTAVLEGEVHKAIEEFKSLA